MEGVALFQVVTRLATDHPHHALPIILALVNADKDGQPTKSVRFLLHVGLVDFTWRYFAAYYDCTNVLVLAQSSI